MNMLKKSYVSFFLTFIISCLFNFSFVFAQGTKPSIPKKTEKNDTSQSSIINLQSTIIPHSPRKATIMSALLPGLGQAYNKKYWKIPILYGGFIACYLYFDYNQTGYTKYNDAYKASINPATKNYPFQGRTYNYDTLHLYSENIRLINESYRKYRDLSVILIVGVYLLNIIDANVDGHLFNFDISDNLSLNAAPYLYLSQNNNYSGISLRLKL